MTATERLLELHRRIRSAVFTLQDILSDDFAPTKELRSEIREAGEQEETERRWRVAEAMPDNAQLRKWAREAEEQEEAENQSAPAVVTDVDRESLRELWAGLHREYEIPRGNPCIVKHDQWTWIKPHLDTLKRLIEAEPAPPVNWDRWHELLDKPSLTRSEKQEYEEYARLARELDAEEGKAADAALDNLVKEHERVIASIRRLTAAVRAAAKQHDLPAPPVEVGMRVVQVGVDRWRWECLLGMWLAASADDRPIFKSRDLAHGAGNSWVGYISDRLGVKLVAQWGEEEPATADGQ